ncbi:DUF6843 domain-containing protein [Gottfriedia solisilvae]|uniref:DUF6843 domain-containing protein n=1 Tax=Gottfriedia solisilvae TaxID=1516104 RepID=A0A8J3EY69_9BACI|nr:hypothetical protein [Gottfriedia solisilvae]GGI13897.1 hypothetical protein GCM10007380_20210 [Gottfriedia solisilvae]
MKKCLMLIIAIFIIGGCSTQEVPDTNELFLIPNGFEGTITVFYNVTDTPVLEKEGTYSVIPVIEASLKQLEGTNINRYGVYLTSSLFRFDEGATISNKYFYVDEKGKRTAIDEKCTYYASTGSFTLDNGKELNYQTIQVTNSQCGQDFYFDGEDRYEIQEREVLKYWKEQAE